MSPLILAALLACASEPDADGDGYPAAVDCDDADSAVFPGATEWCNGLDDDCDELVDEDAADATLFYADADGDGFAGSDYTLLSCDFPAGYQVSSDDCDDGDATIFPEAQELCDGLDNDCDDFVDEGIDDPPTWYADADGDGWGDPDSVLATCDPPDDYVDNDLDCDDSDPDSRPDATWYVDGDGDGYGTEDGLVVGCPPATGAALEAGDCDDTDPATYPGAEELCDGLDNDCDEDIDEEPIDGLTWYLDADGDGWGDAHSTQIACEQPGDYLPDAGDCDPTSASTWPGAEEVCGDGVDQDCNGVADNTCGEEQDAHDLATARAVGPALSPWTVGRRAAAVDLDGDGDLELAAAAPGYDEDGDVDLGRVWLFEGPLSGVIELDAASGGLVGGTDGDALGSRLVGLDEVAGQPALAVAAPGWDDSVEMRGSVGAVGIFVGPLDGASSLDDADGLVQGHRGSNETGGYGLDFGDIDGDGALDLALGTPADSDDNGAIFLAYGPLTGTVSTQDCDRFNGEGSGLGLGDAVAVGADHDGDGITDVLAGASTWHGQAYLWYGPVTSGRNTEDADVFIEGEELGDRLGERLAQGDMDGDGTPDLVLAAPGAQGSAGELDAGAVLVHRSTVTGVEEEAWLRVEGSAADTRLGGEEGALLVADVDEDGISDLLWGLPTADLAGSNAGVVGLLYGPVRGNLEVDRADVLITGPGTTAYLGTDLSLGRGDGALEALVIGSRYGSELGGEALLLPLDALR